MKKMKQDEMTARRQFLGTVAAGAAAFGLASFPLGVKAESLFADEKTNPGNPDEWFNQIKGKHRIVFDATQPHEIFPFAWPKVFLLTNLSTGSPANDCSAVVVLRHTAIGYAFEDRLWQKYKLGEVFGAKDPKTNAASLRNPFWKPKEGDFKVPGIGNVAIGINELQEDGVMFCVCQMAIAVFTARVAETTKMNVDDVRKDWMAGMLPGIQPVPSGVWAVGRAQEHGCTYCFAG
jgi:intracellular sulfur oxidation DsrE/DsrF family protein